MKTAEGSIRSEIPEFSSDLDEVTLDELRRRRHLCDELDSELSYYRRMLHGRMDLLAFEIRRRSGEETRSLIEALDEILADEVRAKGPAARRGEPFQSRHPTSRRPGAEPSTASWRTISSPTSLPSRTASSNQSRRR